MGLPSFLKANNVSVGAEQRLLRQLYPTCRRKPSRGLPTHSINPPCMQPLGYTQSSKDAEEKAWHKDPRIQAGEGDYRAGRGQVVIKLTPPRLSHRALI